MAQLNSIQISEVRDKIDKRHWRVVDTIRAVHLHPNGEWEMSFYMFDSLSLALETLELALSKGNKLYTAEVVYSVVVKTRIMAESEDKARELILRNYPAGSVIKAIEEIEL